MFLQEQCFSLLLSHLGQLSHCQKKLPPRRFLFFGFLRSRRIFNAHVVETCILFYVNNKNTFELDSVTFFFLWGKVITWAVLTIGCLIIALLSYPCLPGMLPIQWNQGEVSSTVHKAFIFGYPAACIFVRFMLRPFIWRMLWKHGLYNDAIIDFVVNFICLLTLSIEVFTVLYLLELVKNVVMLISAETIVFAFILILAWKKQKGILFSS